MMYPLISEQFQPLAKILWLTGSRPDEIFGATIEEYDRQSKKIMKKQHKTKHKDKTRIILCPPEAAKIIEDAIGDRTTGLILPSSRYSKLCAQWLNEMIQTAAIKIGRTKPTCLYSLRHSFAVRLRKHISPHILADMMGHSLKVHEAHYGHGQEGVEEHRSMLDMHA